MSIFDIELFEEKLAKQVQQKKMSGKTKDYYIACAEEINKRCSGPHGGDVAKAIDDICAGNKQGAKYIATVKKYERDVLDSPKALLFGKSLTDLRERYKLPEPGIEIKLPETTYLKKINRLKNERIKLALRLQYKSGLRIGEIAALDKDDIRFNPENKSIALTVRSGKGRKSRTVDVIHDEYLFHRLQAHFETLQDGEKIFYSESYLKKKAGELGIPTHDLRRINSRERFREQRGTGAGRRAARKEVQHQLGHEKPKITNAYLGDEWKGDG